MSQVSQNVLIVSTRGVFLVAKLTQSVSAARIDNAYQMEKVMSKNEFVGLLVLVAIYFAYKIKKSFAKSKLNNFQIQPAAKISKLLQFDYVDSSGNKTTRKVQVVQYEANGNSGLIFGRCLTKKRNRSFRIDRMNNIVDQETGEVIQNIRKFLDTAAGLA